MKSSEIKRRKRLAIVAAIFVSILLFGSGLISGLYASKAIEKRQEQSLETLESRQNEQVESLRSYVGSLDTEFQNVQLQDSFINAIPPQRRCELAQAYFTHTAANLNQYWEALPARIEAYEQQNELTSEYLLLKDKYTIASLRAWIVSSENERNCKTRVQPILYFYNRTCTTCIEQGAELDAYKDDQAQNNTSVIVFTIDKDFKHPVVDLIITYYNITRVPAIVVKDAVFQGTVASAADIGELP